MLDHDYVEVCRLAIRAFDFLSGAEDGIYVVVDGGVVVRDSNADFFLAPGELLFIRRGTYVVGAGERESHVLWIPLSSRFLQDFVRRYGSLLSGIERCEQTCGSAIAFSHTPLLTDCVESLKRLMVHEYPPMLAMLRAEELLMLLMFSPQGPLLMSVLRQKGNRHVERLQTFMEQNYLKEWRLEEFAREFGVSLTVFKELFHSVYAKSPRTWISEQRISYAHHLLLNSEGSIVEVAMESGFSSQSYFTQCYRRHFGCTPSRARQGKGKFHLDEVI
jgi:AraC-like DNA-binding protein